VHLLVECDPQFGIHGFIPLVKGNTSHRLRSAFPSLERRLPSLWTHSYFVATVGVRHGPSSNNPLNTRK